MHNSNANVNSAVVYWLACQNPYLPSQSAPQMKEEAHPMDGPPLREVAMCSRALYSSPAVTLPGRSMGA